MDIYGKLNNEIVKKEYAGSTTDTAKTNINNTSDTISVDVKKVPHKLYVDYEDDRIPNEVFDGSEDVTLVIPELGSVISLESRMNTAEQNISTLQGNVTTLNNKEAELERGLSNEITARTNADTNIENNAKNIKIKDNGNGSFDFTNYQNQTITIQSGYPADNDTIKVIDNKLTAQAIKDSTGTITPQNIRDIDNRIHVASMQQMGMVYSWKDNNGKVYISLTDPMEVNYDTEPGPNNSVIYNFSTYNYQVETLPNGSLAYSFIIEENN